MNYRHGFHAGNHADVLKHTVLLALIDHLKQKAAPFFVLDSHAGSGAYLLDNDQARRTDEAQTGIAKLWTVTDLPAPLRRYIEAVRVHNADGELRLYPGSPLLIAEQLRDGPSGPDRLACCELHPEEFVLLKDALHSYKYVSPHLRDGYQALRALLPPKFGEQRINRGLILIDPPYEQQDEEYPRIVSALTDGISRFPQAIYLIWYPIKQRRKLHGFFREINKLPIKSHSFIELLIRPDDSPLRLNGSGVLIINSPWQFEDSLRPALETMHRHLGEAGSSYHLERIEH